MTNSLNETIGLIAQNVFEELGFTETGGRFYPVRDGGRITVGKTEI